MRNALVVGLIIVITAGLYIFKTSQHTNISPPAYSGQSSSTKPTGNSEKFTILATGLDTPWAIGFLPDKSLLVTERPGKIRLISPDGQLESDPVASLSQVKEIGEGGLLGLAVHPDFSINNFIYLYYTYKGSGSDTLNRVVRMTYSDKKLTEEKIIVDNIPGSSNHNGGRIKFGPDKNLYITTGDAENPSQAQNTATLGGKILRVTDEGQPVSDNPFNNLVYSYGHRNPQGITWDDKGQLWQTEHGRSLPSGYDEINLIEKGKNYGWPTIQGDESKDGMISPIANSGASMTWAPADVAYFEGTLFFTGLRGQKLYKAVINGKKVENITEVINSDFGRLREAILGPDNMLYVTTSNWDGRGIPKTRDDKVIKIDLQKL